MSEEVSNQLSKRAETESGKAEDGTAVEKNDAELKGTPRPDVPVEFGVRAKALLILVLAGILAAGWYHHTLAWKPKHFAEILDEITAVGEFRKAPVVNHAAQHLWYARSSEHGVGLYHTDLETLARRKVVAVEVVDRGGDYYNIFGWSPDDRYVLYTETTDSRQNSQQATLCDGNDYSFISIFDMPDRIEEGVWVTTNSFVLLDRQKNLYLCNVHQEPLFGQNGRERTLKLKQLQNNESTGFLMAMDDTHIAYLERGNLYAMNLADKKIQKLNQFDISKNQECEWVNFNRKNGQFLFCRRNPSSKSWNRNLYRFDPSGSSGKDLVQLNNSRESVLNGRWILDGSGYTYVGNSNGVSYLAIRTQNKTLNTNLFTEGHVRSYSVSPNGEKLFAVASEQDEPQGIWEYNIKKRVLRCVTPAQEKPFHYSEIISPLRDTVKASDGRTVPYYLLPPRDFDFHNKYPVVIDGPSDSRWQPHSQFLANMGVYYISVSRRGLDSSDDLSDGAKDIMAVYKHLIENPNIDGNRVFIMGFSASTILVKELAEQFPKNWRGLILNGPVAYPKIEDASHFPAIFISMGEEDTRDRLEGVQRFEATACANLIPIHGSFPKEGGHIFSSKELVRQRSGELVKFILQN